jgi:hypothetical protein
MVLCPEHTHQRGTSKEKPKRGLTFGLAVLAHIWGLVRALVSGMTLLGADATLSLEDTRLGALGFAMPVAEHQWKLV